MDGLSYEYHVDGLKSFNMKKNWHIDQKLENKPMFYKKDDFLEYISNILSSPNCFCICMAPVYCASSKSLENIMKRADVTENRIGIPRMQEASLCVCMLLQ